MKEITRADIINHEMDIQRELLALANADHGDADMDAEYARLHVQLHLCQWARFGMDPHAERDAALVELSEERRARTHLAALLAATALAIKGAPAPLTMHSWADLPVCAAKLKAELEALRQGSAHGR